MNEHKHVIFLSGGLGSWAAMRRVADKHGTDNLYCLFTDTLIEDIDLYRFLIEGLALQYGVDAPKSKAMLADIPETSFNTQELRKEKLTELAAVAMTEIPRLYWVNDGRDVWDIFFDDEMLGNSRLARCSHVIKQDLARCSHVIKQDLARRVIENNFDADNTTLYLGIDWTEEHRTSAPRKNWQPYDVQFPMCDEPYVTNIDHIKELERLDIKLPRLYTLGFQHNNCHSGDTAFINKQGFRNLREAEGHEVDVLGVGGNWKRARVSSFGKQPLLRVTLKRGTRYKEVESTPDHRYLVQKGKVREMRYTKQLAPGDKLSTMLTKRDNSVKMSPIGIMHGLTFGDGTYARNSWNNPATLTLCGDKQELGKYFHESHDVKEVKGVGIKISELPKYFKSLPDMTESKSYLKGWLAGYIATDGSMSDCSATLSTADKGVLDAVLTVCDILGVHYLGTTEYWRKGFNDKETPVYTITFYRDDFFKSLLIYGKHIAAYTNAVRPIGDWEVVSVEDTGKVDEVYCATVPDGEKFTLRDYVFQYNCGGFCVRAGQGHFINLLQQRPGLFDYHEKQELRWQEETGKDYTILRKQRNGVRYKLTLKELREEYEEKQKAADIDFDDIGGCGCFVDYA